MKLAHPGTIILQEYLEPAGLKAADLARATGLSTGRISELLNGKRDITAEIALRLERATGIAAKLWLGLQDDYDLLRLRKEKMPLIKSQTHALVIGDVLAATV
jgi:addiction module HigA family antidote